MKKFLYILSILIAVVLLDSCTKEDVFRCDGDNDPFGIENIDDDADTRALDENGGGVIVDDDEDDDDEDGDVIVDDDEDDDDESDTDDNEQLDDRVGGEDED